APGPWLVRVMVKTASSPASIGPLPSLTTSRSGHWTSTEAEASPAPSLPVVTDAVLSIVPQSVASVCADTWTAKLSPEAMLSSSQVSAWLPGAPVTWQDTPVVSPVTAPRLHVTPAGSGSETWTSVAAPVPLLVTVTSNPISSPALTGPAGLAVFAMPISAQSTSIAPSSELLPACAAGSFAASTLARV